jgi:hypothetical protein
MNTAPTPLSHPPAAPESVESRNEPSIFNKTKDHSQKTNRQRTTNEPVTNPQRTLNEPAPNQPPNPSHHKSQKY